MMYFGPKHLLHPFLLLLLPSFLCVKSSQVCDILRQACEKEEWCLSMDWREGDFALVDNLALAHYAHASTQAGRERCGLRILHRTTVAGDHRPTK